MSHRVTLCNRIEDGSLQHGRRKVDHPENGKNMSNDKAVRVAAAAAGGGAGLALGGPAGAAAGALAAERAANKWLTSSDDAPTDGEAGEDESPS